MSVVCLEGLSRLPECVSVMCLEGLSRLAVQVHNFFNINKSLKQNVSNYDHTAKGLAY